MDIAAGGGVTPLRVSYIRVYTVYTPQTVYTVYTQPRIYSTRDVSLQRALLGWKMGFPLTIVPGAPAGYTSIYEYILYILRKPYIPYIRSRVYTVRVKYATQQQLSTHP